MWKLFYLFSLLVLLGMIALLLSAVFDRDRSSSRDLSREEDSQLTSSPSITALPASSQLATQVRNTVVIADSFYSPHRGGDSYRLHILMNSDAEFMPVAVQLTNISEITPPVTAMLTFESNLKCYNGPYYESVGKPAYQTEWLSGSQLYGYNSEYPYYPERGEKFVNLIVKTNEGLFLVEGLRVTRGCSREVV